MSKPDEQSKQKARHKQSTNLIHEPKLTWNQVNEIRQSYVRRSSRNGTTALAARYGVSPNNIYKVLRGRTWKVKDGDGNVRPPLQDHITAKAFSDALIGTQTSRARLQHLARKYRLGDY